MAVSTPQSIAYPAPGSRPHRIDEEKLDPHVIVLFGATGDLAKRKLLPGMAYLVQSSLAPKIRVVGTSLEDLTGDEFRALAREAVDAFGSDELTDEEWEGFACRISTAEGIESLWDRSTPLLEDPPPVKIYQPGTWGPNAIHQLIAPNAWRLPFEREWREKKTE